MAGINDYSNTAGSNTTINGIDIAEGCSPAGINNAIRQLMADTRSQWNDANWFEYGDGAGSVTITYVSGTSFTVGSVDVTTPYHTGRRIKAVGSTTGTIYGTISSSSFSTDTTVNVTWDSGSLQNESLTIYLSILESGNDGIPESINHKFDINGNELVLDADGDTSLTADTDDQIDVRVAGADQVRIIDGAINPVTDSDINLGTNALRYANVYADTYYGDGSNLTGLPSGDVVEDTTPQLGGNLDLNSNNITGTGDLNFTGSITLTGNVDGRDVSADGTKLDTIATSATANPNAIDNLVEDLTPELGGALSTNGNDINFGDNDKANFGASNDLQIYHDGTNSYVKDNGTGDLYLQGTANVRLTNTTGSKMFLGQDGGEAQLYYAGAEKLATKSTGVNVTGTVVSDGLTVDGDVTINTGAGALTVDAFGGASVQVSSNGSYKHISALASGYHLFEVNNKSVAKFNNNGDISFYEDTGTTDKFFWDASAERLGIRTTSPVDTLHINSGGIRIYDNADGNGGVLAFGTSAGYQTISGSSGSNNIYYRTYANHIWKTATGASSTTDGTERMRIDSSGNVLVGTTTSLSSSVEGIILKAQGDIEAYRASNRAALFGRNDNDGTIVTFAQADIAEGTISVSGTTVSYNGGHLARWSQLTTNTRDESILKGTVMSNLDEMCVWGDEDNEQLNKMKVSDTEGDDNVAGVFVNWDNDDDVYTNDMNVAMTGDMVIRIAQGVTVTKGQLLMSAGDGTAKPQGDDIVRSKTIAKVTSNNVTKTYDDGSYLVPCVLMAC